MTVGLIALTVLVAVAVAVRSTWSPCGLSMLSTITPIAEASRGHRFRSTAAWFVVGSIVGGATLGGLMALLAVGISLLNPSPSALLWTAGIGALLTAASDARVAGIHFPGHHRQVNERWLDQYRSWVYGSGFGWEIGVGLATYIMTAGLYLLILMGALIDQPSASFGIGVLFGLVRGLAVYLATNLTTKERLLTFHARFESLREPVRQAMVIVQATVAVAVIWLARPGTALLAVTAAAAALVLLSMRGPRESVQAAPATAPAGA